MAENSSLMNNHNVGSSSTSITDLNIDSLLHCADYLSIQDITNLAITCKSLKTAVYSDSIWHRLFRETWPEQILGHNTPGIQVREAFLNRHTAVRQFNFVDPLVTDFCTDARPFSHVLLGRNCVVFAQGPLVRILKIDDLKNAKGHVVEFKDHTARITCMRLFPPSEASFIRSETQTDDDLLITSSSDHSIRIWWKNSCFRCWRGHNGPVSILSDKLLGEDGSKVLASGGEDGTLRLWSLNSSGRRGQHALTATLHGHEKPIKLLSIAGHKTSLLVSVATDSKIRVWDSALASASWTSSCVGSSSLIGTPVGIKCYESMLYVAVSSSVHGIDLRTMKKVFSAAVGQSEISSFEMLPSRSLICTGASHRALLWDIRKSQEGSKADPVAVMEGHTGTVKHIHMDPYKIVTGGPDDLYTNVWEVETGNLRNSLLCCDPEQSSTIRGCNAMAVDGCRIVSVSSGREGLVRFRDFTNASSSVCFDNDAAASKFWNPTYSSDSDSDV